MRLEPRRCSFCGSRYFLACARCVERALGYRATAADLRDPLAPIRLSLPLVAGETNRN